MKIAFDVAFAAGLGLHRLVPQRAVERRNSGGRIAKVGALQKCRHEREAVVLGAQLSVQTPRRVTSFLTSRHAVAGIAGVASGAGWAVSAAGREGSSASLPVSDLDFSSFIIGDGVTTASVIATIR